MNGMLACFMLVHIRSYEAVEKIHLYCSIYFLLPCYMSRS